MLDFDSNNVHDSNDLKDQFPDEGAGAKYISGMYRNWFLDYASYVILERAVPHIDDGLKPVQRRILHSMKKLDDGRYNKVANLIGHTMQYHPHGDASIGDALVQLGQKELLIDMQGNWGNIYTGDSAAAPRYIEARLSKFASEVVFNPKTTEWKLSYDGRNNEPVTLPVKFPLLLAQGVEGIAVGLASKILPHNFIELIDASVAHLRGEDFELVPDFPTAGMADFSKYNDGLRGGRVRVRAKIEKRDSKTLAITDIPFGKTTGTLIETILSANEKGKIKIKKIDDNTAAEVEILVHLIPGTSPDKTIDALYAFTDCEVSISPNACVIRDNKPAFIGVTEILKHNTDKTLNLLRTELEIRLNELEDSWHLSSLEKIFIENRIYLLIEDCETWEDVLSTIDRGLDPFKKTLRREVVHDDLLKLTEIKIKRISKFDGFKADEYVKSLEAEMVLVKHHLDHIVKYTIDYFIRIKEKYGKGKERKTEIRSFDTIEAAKVVVRNEKLYVNRTEGFAGTGLKKDEYVGDCADIDDMIVFRKNGTYVITKVADKVFVGKDVIHIAVFSKNDERTIYNCAYADGDTGNTYVKRFAVKGITRDKEYDVTKGAPNSKILYFTENPNGEAEIIKVTLKPKPRIKKLNFEFDFSTLEIKGRASQGNILTKYAIHKIVIKEKGLSTLGGRRIWYDASVMRLNTEERGMYLGEFSGADQIIVFTQSGNFNLHSFDLSTYFEDDIILIEKYNAERIYTVAFWEGEQNFYYLKRFQIVEGDKPDRFVGEHPNSKFYSICTDTRPRLELSFGGKYKNRPAEIIDAEEFIGVKSFKARGKRLSTYDIAQITALEPIIQEEKLIEFEVFNAKTNTEITFDKDEKAEQTSLDL